MASISALVMFMSPVSSRTWILNLPAKQEQRESCGLVMTKQGVRTLCSWQPGSNGVNRLLLYQIRPQGGHLHAAHAAPLMESTAKQGPP